MLSLVKWRSFCAKFFSGLFEVCSHDDWRPVYSIPNILNETHFQSALQSSIWDHRQDVIGNTLAIFRFFCYESSMPKALRRNFCLKLRLLQAKAKNWFGFSHCKIWFAIYTVIQIIAVISTACLWEQPVKFEQKLFSAHADLHQPCCATKICVYQIFERRQAACQLCIAGCRGFKLVEVDGA